MPNPHNTTPAVPALVTHTIATLRGPQTSDITITHARTTDARISIVLSGILLILRSADVAHGLLEAFTAARAHTAQIPRLLPAPAPQPDEPAVRTTLAIEWRTRAAYAVEHRTGLNQAQTAVLHWVDLYCGNVTFRFRDQAALTSIIDIFTDAWNTSTVVFLDGAAHTTHPAPDAFTAA